MDKQTGTSKGFGFVEMPKSGAAKAAVFNLNGMEFDGSKIRVKKAKPTPNPGAETANPNQDQISHEE